MLTIRSLSLYGLYEEEDTEIKQSGFPQDVAPLSCLPGH